MHAPKGALAVAVVLAGSLVWVSAQGGDVAIDLNDIGGVVTSANGPEAGVWVVAETTDLPTKLARIVVTDDQGRYVVPDLPDARYDLFVRGYGLVDSARQSARPGQQLNLDATLAPDARTAAQVYPAAWWLNMITPPAEPEAQLEFALTMKSCYDCHQVGNRATREILPAMRGRSGSSLDVWTRRTGVGPSGPGMAGVFTSLGPMRQALADWSDRVAAGEAPTAPPPRPAGVERNLVVTLWDWGSEIDARSDMAAGDIRDATVNANGPVYGVAEMTDSLTILDPVTHRASVVKVPSVASVVVQGFNAAPTRSPHYGESVWARRADVRSSAIDGKGRVWMASRLRDRDQQPDFCTSAENPFGAYYPIAGSSRQVSIYDPATGAFEQIDTCFTADHNQMSDDNFLYFGQNGAVGWIDMATWDETHDAEASQGWGPAVIDTTGDGRITEWTEPDAPIGSTLDHRINFGCYSVAVSHADGSLWCSGIGRGDRRLVRIEKGSNPPETCQAEYYEPPPGMDPDVIGSGGVEVDGRGVAWQNWRVSGHFSSFDRTLCDTTSDQQATGQSCPEGWSFRRKDDPTYGDSFFHANESYLAHMDFHDTLGLGAGAPIYGSVNTDAMEVFSPNLGRYVTMRVPYPLGFFPRSGNGRIDDPGAGWKGKGYWASFSTYATWHIEGGKGEGGSGVLPKVVKFQMRPDPLAH